MYVEELCSVSRGVLVTTHAAEFILPSGGTACGIFCMVATRTNAHMECRALLFVRMIKYLKASTWWPKGTSTAADSVEPAKGFGMRGR